ncbi:MAG: hypothetical protein M3R37_03690 [Actinomycetota bacterium]|nr:hypothetical protein [Actinomycetota bacterium]
MKRFAKFWWDFLVGDDWRIAAGIVIAFGLTALLAATSIPAWWILPVAVAAVLWLSLRRYVDSADIIEAQKREIAIIEPRATEAHHSG